MPKVKLSPEERRELKKQKKLEKKQKREEKRRQINRDHLVREVNYGDLTYRRYEKNWREMLTKVALPRMRADLEFAWHNFERVIDAKDFTISLLMDEIREAEEQYMCNFRAHLENIDKLLLFYKERLLDFRQDYESEVEKLQTKYETEAEEMKDVSSENLNYLKTMLHWLDMARREQERTKRAEYYSILDENEIKNQLLLQKLKANLESKHQSMFDNMQQFIHGYSKRIKERKNEYTKLKTADDAIQVLIVQQFKQIRRMYDTQRHQRQQLNDMKQTEGLILHDLQVERQFFFNSLLELKNKLHNDQKDDFNKMAQLSQWCNQVFDYLEKLNKKGQNILTLATVCRKLETQKEKILPFPIALKEQKAVSELEKKTEEEDGDNEVSPEMDLFWQRAGQAYSIYYALERERECLTEENQLIVDTHNDYCEKILYSQPIKRKSDDKKQKKGEKEKHLVNRSKIDYFLNLIVEKLDDH